MFLEVIGRLITPFSVHEKHQKYDVKSLNEAITLVSECLTVLKANIAHINSTHKNLPKKLNGPEGSISAKTFESIFMLETGLKQLKENLDLFGYKNVNLLSGMTFDIEHLHSTVNYKHGMQTMLQYARSFTSSIKECVKSLTRWSAYYFTSTESWYPLPSGSLKLSELSFPKPILPSNLPAAERVIMREWASVNGAVVKEVFEQKRLWQRLALFRNVPINRSLCHEKWSSPVRKEKEVKIRKHKKKQHRKRTVIERMCHKGKTLAKIEFHKRQSHQLN